MTESRDHLRGVTHVTDIVWWFRVFIVVNVLPRGKVLIFIIGWPFYQYLAMLLITTMAFQLRIRRNNSDQMAVKFCADLGGSV